MYHNDIMTATKQLLVAVPELIKGLDNFGFTIENIVFKYIVSTGNKDGSLSMKTSLENCNEGNEDVISTAERMTSVRCIEVQFSCRTDCADDMLTIQITGTPSKNEFGVTCKFQKYTAVFLSERDITRKLKREEPVEVPTDCLSYQGSINFIPKALYPLNTGNFIVVKPQYLYPTYSKTLEEQKYLMDRYSEVIEVLEHSDTNQPGKFDVYHMRRCIERLPIDLEYKEHKKELLKACELNIDTLNFSDPVLIDKFFSEYRRQLKLRCDEFERLMGFRIENEVQAKNNSWYENALLELADAISK